MGALLIVDNTVATPMLVRPGEYGADVIVHSLTKFMGGHGTTLGGIVVDAGRFPFERHAPRYPMFTEPDESYHGLVYTEHFGAAAFIGRCRSVYQRTMGAVLSPLNAFLLLQGIETVALRVDRHVENARKVAEFLRGRPARRGGELRRLRGQSLLPAGAEVSRRPCLFAADLRDPRRLRRRACASTMRCKLFKRLVNLGDAKSLACHPASTTHRQMSPAEQWPRAWVRAASASASASNTSTTSSPDLDQALGRVARGMNRAP